jgi:predicted nucleotidyltransferase
VVLFGSYATGRAGVGSDVDLVVEVAESALGFGERLTEETGRGLPVPADILVYTSAELARMRAEGRRFARELESGVVLWSSAD